MDPYSSPEANCIPPSRQHSSSWTRQLFWALAGVAVVTATVATLCVISELVRPTYSGAGPLRPFLDAITSAGISVSSLAVLQIVFAFSRRSQARSSAQGFIVGALTGSWCSISLAQRWLWPVWLDIDTALPVSVFLSFAAAFTAQALGVTRGINGRR